MSTPQWFQLGRTLSCCYCHVEPFEPCRVMEHGRPTDRQAAATHDVRIATAKALFAAGVASIDGNGEPLMHVLAIITEGQRFAVRTREDMHRAIKKAVA